jgi:hypothetical protein
MSNERHTAIDCKHSTQQVRNEIIKAISESGALSPLPAWLLVDNTLTHDAHTVDMARLVTAITAACSRLMWEHSDETAAEYRKIVAMSQDVMQSTVRDLKRLLNGGDITKGGSHD